MTFLFVLIVVVGIGLVGFLVYAGGALLTRPKRPPAITRVDYLAMPTLPSTPPPAPPARLARGTTPQPLSGVGDAPALARAESPIPGVISNREDATERMVQPDDRFSVRRSRPRY